MSSVFVRQTLTLLLKDLRREVRTKEILTTTVSFAVLLMVVFTFAFYQDDESVKIVFPGILWVSILFSGVLAIGRTFAQEKDGGCLRAIALIPGTDLSLYYAKLIINLLFLLTFEAILLPILALAFNVAIVAQLPLYAVALVVPTLGFVAIGTLIAAMLVHSHLREVLLPVLLFPLAVPLIIVGVKITAALFEGADFATIWPWLKLAVAMDFVYVFIAQFLFRWVLSAIE
ncbi:MAG: heme exporter protein CcmB [Bradymonadaceae bacterium]|nr:heme exporter protein CcmB [Lujinxingiaceae bacterium]